jgi:succinate dehydrogenase iron-sulfur subunit
MRLRRIADRQDIEDVNNGRRHMEAFTKIIQKKGTLDEALLLQESYAPGVKGKLKPPRGAIKGLIESIPTAIRGIRTGKMRSLPKLIPGVHKKLPGDAQDHVKRIYTHTEGHEVELNLYIRGEEADQEAPEAAIEPEPDEVEEAAARPGTDSGLAPGGGS